MRYIVIGNVLVFLLDLFSTGGYPICHQPAQFQFWMRSYRANSGGSITFVICPRHQPKHFPVCHHPLLLLLHRQRLEREWGSNKFTIFYFFGILLNILVGFLVGTASMYYVNMSMFFAFATLYPNLQFLLFFIIPVKGQVAGLD